LLIVSPTHTATNDSASLPNLHAANQSCKRLQGRSIKRTLSHRLRATDERSAAAHMRSAY
jgi:hypothetical protein